jgi:hypothetical protein
VPGLNYNPDYEHVEDFLSDEEDSFRTSELRAYLSMKGDSAHPTAPLNRLLLDLKQEGYLAPEEYGLNGNHQWKIVETPEIEQ